VNQQAIAQQLKDLLSSSQVQLFQELDADSKKQFIQAGVAESAIAVHPNSQEELAKLIGYAHQHQWKLLPCGNATKLSWGALIQGVDLIVSTTRLNRLIEHASGDMTVTAEAGMKLSELQTIVAQAGQFLPLDPLYSVDATLGGIVATASAGSLRQRYGGVRDLLLGISFVRADGQIAKAGGRVVKNVAGYDLMKLFTGSYGTLGVFSQLTWRVYALPEDSQTMLLTGADEAISQVIHQLIATTFTPTAVDLLLPTTVAALGMGDHLGLLVRFQTIAAGVTEQSNRLSELSQTLGLNRSTYHAVDEHTLWQQLRELIEDSPETPSILCKMGVQPANAVATLMQINQKTASAGFIHAGSGVGLLRIKGTALEPQTLLEIRQLCEKQGGFLSVLEAPIALKQKLDVWGYAGNALDLMSRIKQQFDPECLLSPHRSVGGL
jgi:glycolate oxidase FAD binding subunit